MPPDHPAVVLEHLTKRYGSFTALDDVSLTLSAGQIFGLIGPNGAGKTTTIKILVGLIRPTQGQAQIAGADCVRDARKIKRLVGYMPDQFGSFDNMRVWEYLDFFGAAFGIPRRKRMTRIEEIMETTGTTYMKDRFVESLSHGMQQRVGVARTLIHDPQVLILDEPANGLDPQARIEMRTLLLKLAQLGKTLLVTSHILPDLSRICDRVGILTQGKLRAFGTVDQIGRLVSQQRTIEAHLIGAERISAAAQIIRRAIEPGADVVEATAEEVVRFRTALPEARTGQTLAHVGQRGNSSDAVSRSADRSGRGLHVVCRCRRNSGRWSPRRAPRMVNPIVQRELVAVLRTAPHAGGAMRADLRVHAAGLDPLAERAARGALGSSAAAGFSAVWLRPVDDAAVAAARVSSDEYRPREEPGDAGLVAQYTAGPLADLHRQIADRAGPGRHRAGAEPAGGRRLLCSGGAFAHGRISSHVRRAGAGRTGMCRAGTVRQQLFEFGRWGRPLDLWVGAFPERAVAGPAPVLSGVGRESWPTWPIRCVACRLSRR